MANFVARFQARRELITGVLMERQLGIIGAATKSMKTLTGLDACMSLATGTNFLGYANWRCPQPMRVAFFSGESGADSLNRTYEAIAAAKTQGLDSAERTDLSAAAHRQLSN